LASASGKSPFIFFTRCEVGNDRNFSWLQHSDDFATRLLAASWGWNVVEARVGDHDVKAGMREVPVLCILIVRFDAVSDTFKYRIGHGVFFAVIGQILLAPKVDAYNSASGSFRRADQEPTPSAYVEHGFLPIPFNEVQNSVPAPELTHLRVIDYQ
jgi:hypothetical protein